MRILTPYVCSICATRLPRAAARCFFCGEPLPNRPGKAAPAWGASPPVQPRIYVTARDFARLEQLAHLGLAECDAAARTLLREELDRAVVCSNDEAPSGLVGMGSTVLVRDDDGNGALQKLRGALVYPGEQHPSLPSIPVSTPLGAAILGLSVGDAMVYSPGGDAWHVVGVLSVHAPMLQPPPEPPAGPCAA